MNSATRHKWEERGMRVLQAAFYATLMVLAFWASKATT